MYSGIFVISATCLIHMLFLLVQLGWQNVKMLVVFCLDVSVLFDSDNVNLYADLKN